MANDASASSVTTPDKLRKSILAHFAVRLHICLILTACFIVGLIITKLLLLAGVHQMWIRYAVALFMAYVAFLCGVWIWLRYAGFERRILPSRRSSLADAANSINFGGSGGSSGGGGGSIFRGSGGSSGGGGASASFGEASSGHSSSPMFALSSHGGSSSGGGGFDFGDDGWVIVALIALLAAVFGAVVWIVYAAPTILADAAFAGMLSGGLVRSTRHIASGGWVESVLGHTWLAFAVVFVLAMVFAFLAQRHFPDAHTLVDVIKSL